LSGEGLEPLLAALWRLAPEGDPMYPPEYYTDQTPEFRIAEIVREKAMRDLREEVPHALFVHIEDLEMRADNTELWARGFIFVERDSQKGILVGRGGERIRATVRDAEAELAGLFPYAVKLDLRVKVRPKWRRDEALLSRLLR
jgi:GTP-binding protein Era